MKYRLKFSKEGPIRYIGHLDVMRYFQKAIRRANLPIAYSEGFSPHQIMSFAFPLSVGYTSEGEYFDIELTEQVNTEQIENDLNLVMAEGIKILAVRELPEKAGNCMSLVYAATYLVRIKERVELPQDYEDKYIDLFSQMTISVNKPKKKGGGYISLDLKEFLYDFKIDNRNMIFTVNASSSDNIKPSFVASVFFDYMGIPFSERDINVHRIEMWGNELGEGGLKLTSLMDI